MAGLSPPRPRYNVGALYLVPLLATPDTKRIGKIQDVKLTPETEIALLGGENRYAEDAAVKTAKLGGSISFTEIDADLYVAAMPGAVKTTGSEELVLDEAATIPGTPFAVTVTGSASFGTDLGVYDVTAGLRMECVTGTPTTGQYAVAAGVYTFASADTTHAVKISYSTTAATGETITISQTLSEANAVFFALRIYSKTNGKTETITLNKVLIHGMELGWKFQDWATYGLTFTALPDSTGVVGTIKRSA